MLELANESLEKKILVFGVLDPKLTHLETQVGDLRRQFNIDHDEIVTHGHILEKLMEEDEEEEDSSE